MTYGWNDHRKTLERLTDYANTCSNVRDAVLAERVDLTESAPVDTQDARDELRAAAVRLTDAAVAIDKAAALLPTPVR